MSLGDDDKTELSIIARLPIRPQIADVTLRYHFRELVILLTQRSHQLAHTGQVPQDLLDAEEGYEESYYENDS